jgi:hypothetical protein
LFLITFVSLSLEKESGRSKTREEVLAEERDYKKEECLTAARK